MKIYENVLDTIGNTPLIKVNRIFNKPNVTLAVKFEGANPSGSVKDRVALGMIEQAEREGTLTKGKTIIEATSGNTGIGLAMAACVKGYEIEIVMSEGVSAERKRMLEAFGAKLVLTDAKSGTDGARMEARRRVERSPERYFAPDQFSNYYNPYTHYSVTAEEILRDTDGKLTHFVAALGTGGTLTGVGRRLKEANPDIRIIAAEPEPHHRIQGLKNLDEALRPKVYDESVVDETIMVGSEQSFELARRLAREEGIFAGMSAGAALLAAITAAKKLDSGLVVCLLADRGEKYLSTELYTQSGPAISLSATRTVPRRA